MTAPRTLNELFFTAMDRFRDRPAYQRVKRGDGWLDIPYRDVYERVQALAAAFHEMGIQRGDRIAILSENRPEWAVTDIACLTIRCADVPV